MHIADQFRRELSMGRVAAVSKWARLKDLRRTATPVVASMAIGLDILPLAVEVQGRTFGLGQRVPEVLLQSRRKFWHSQSLVPPFRHVLSRLISMRLHGPLPGVPSHLAGGGLRITHVVA